jgi:hypothetical protein
MDGGWLAWIQLEDPPGASPATTVGTYNTVEHAQAATDDFWEAHRRARDHGDASAG